MEKKSITLLPAPDIDYQTIVTAVDTVRSFKAVVAASVVDAELFPDISFGDAPSRKRGRRMSSSLRSRRMARNHKRMAQHPRLNLVALMDIFTILVLFLMVNSGDVEVLQSDPDISLPESLSEQRRNWH